MLSMSPTMPTAVTAGSSSAISTNSHPSECRIGSPPERLGVTLPPRTHPGDQHYERQEDKKHQEHRPHLDMGTGCHALAEISDQRRVAGPNPCGDRPAEQNSPQTNHIAGAYSRRVRSHTPQTTARSEEPRAGTECVTYL